MLYNLTLTLSLKLEPSRLGALCPRNAPTTPAPLVQAGRHVARMEDTGCEASGFGFKVSAQGIGLRFTLKVLWLVRVFCLGFGFNVNITLCLRTPRPNPPSRRPGVWQQSSGTFRPHIHFFFQMTKTTVTWYRVQGL